MNSKKIARYKNLIDANKDKEHEGFGISSILFALSILLIGCAEFALLYYSDLGLLMYAGIIVLIITGLILFHKLESKKTSSRSVKYTEAANFLKALSIVPLIRILDFTLPLELFSPIYWPLIVGIPLLLGVGVLARILRIELNDVGIVVNRIPLQVIIASSGISFGLIEYSLIRPAPLITTLTFSNAILPAIILLIFTGFTEELIFRGILQNVASRLFSPSLGILYASLLFTLMHLGQPFQDPALLQTLASPDLLQLIKKLIFAVVPYLTYIFAASVFYGIIFQKTRILTGISASHGFTNIIVYLIAPFVF